MTFKCTAAPWEQNTENKRQCNKSVLFGVDGWVWCSALGYCFASPCSWYMEWVEIVWVRSLMGLLKCHCELCVCKHSSLKKAVRWLSLIVYICTYYLPILCACQTWVKQNLHIIHSDGLKKNLIRYDDRNTTYRKMQCVPKQLLATALHHGQPRC